MAVFNARGRTRSDGTLGAAGEELAGQVLDAKSLRGRPEL
jgi:hypothetical protein